MTKTARQPREVTATSRKAVLTRLITERTHELTKEKKQLKTAKKKLADAYEHLMDLVDRLSNLKVHGTKKEATLKVRITESRAENIRLTQMRNTSQSKIDMLTEQLATLDIEMAMLREQEINETKTIDDIVIQVFGLNQSVIAAATAREECLKRHVFPRLIDENGKLSSQITFASSDGLRKVVAMVNTMTIIRADLAREAQAEIQRFFDRFQTPAKVDQNIEALFALVKQLLIEKTDFKVGPDLYRFLAMELDPDRFPELARAQTLLRQSIRSEKTNSYIRIYERVSRHDPWVVVPQS